MPVVSRFGLLGGIHTGPGQAGPEHCSDALNWYSTQGENRVRGGQRAKFAAPLRGVLGYGQCAFSVGEPVAVTDTDPFAAALPITAAGGDTEFYYGASLPFELLRVLGQARNSTAEWFGDEDPGYPLELNYWNGTAWATLTGKNVFGSKYNPTFDEYTSGPWWNVGANNVSGTQLLVTLRPPSDWAPKVIGGFNLYWLRVICPGAAEVGIGGGTVTSAEHYSVATPVAGLLPFISRNGGRHLFGVMKTLTGPIYAVGDVPPYRGDSVMTELAQSGDLSEVTGVSSDGTYDVWLGYAAQSDRVVGHIVGKNWFYWVPGDTTVNLLDADPVGTNTPYASVPGGLSGAIPGGSHRVLHDGRLFIADGQTIRWSSPGVYLDLWPNRNELVLSDQYGPITGMLTVNGVLAVFKRNIIYTLTPNGDADGYDAMPMPSGVGCVGGLTACGSFCLFISTDGLFRFDGNDLTKLSEKLDEMFFLGQVGSDLTKARGVYFGPLNQWRLFFPKGEAFVLDRAFYVDLTGYTDDSRGDPRTEVAVWPQGTADAAQYGFDATCVVVDNTESDAVMLMGGRRGIVWEADAGTMDVGVGIAAYLTQADQNLGKTGGVLARRLNATMKTDTHAPLTVAFLPNGIPATPSTLGSATMDNWKDVSATAQADADDLASSSLVAVATRPYITRESMFSLRCRSFAVSISTAGGRGQSPRLMGLEFEANKAGRRGEHA